MLLSIVIVTYNSQAYIEACLNAVYAQRGGNLDVIVVDNASVDKTTHLIRETFGQVRLIENRSNLGVCKARNQGINISTGKWVLTLDSDVVLGQGFIDRFVAIQDGFADDIGMIQSNILGADGARVYSQGIYLSALRRFYDVNQGKKTGDANLEVKRIIGPCSAAAFYRRKMLDQLKEVTGYFDERFFFLVEDVDLAWRARRAGWKACVDLALVCFHSGNGSMTDHQRRRFLCFRNRHWMIAKNESFLTMGWVYFIAMPYELVRGIYLVMMNAVYSMKGSGRN